MQIRKKNERQEQLVKLVRMMDKSHGSCLEKFEKEYVTCQEPEEFDLPPLLEEQNARMIKCWNAFKQMQKPGNGSNEKEPVGACFKMLLKIIIKNFDVAGRLRVQNDDTVMPPTCQFNLAVSVGVKKRALNNVVGSAAEGVLEESRHRV
jgi:hypothetical protein